ncbi:MAG: hypothetical protein K2N31_09260 [Treponemataceae bacterium]|nr:hypothetical protein [Treponemataceae bacterium]
MKTKAARLSAKPEAERRKTKGLQCTAHTLQTLQKDVYLKAVSKEHTTSPTGWQEGRARTVTTIRTR